MPRMKSGTRYEIDALLREVRRVLVLAQASERGVQTESYGPALRRLLDKVLALANLVDPPEELAIHRAVDPLSEFRNGGTVKPPVLHQQLGALIGILNGILSRYEFQPMYVKPKTYEAFLSAARAQDKSAQLELETVAKAAKLELEDARQALCHAIDLGDCTYDAEFPDSVFLDPEAIAAHQVERLHAAPLPALPVLAPLPEPVTTPREPKPPHDDAGHVVRVKAEGSGSGPAGTKASRKRPWWRTNAAKIAFVVAIIGLLGTVIEVVFGRPEAPVQQGQNINVNYNNPSINVSATPAESVVQRDESMPTCLARAELAVTDRNLPAIVTGLDVRWGDSTQSVEGAVDRDAEMPECFRGLLRVLPVTGSGPPQRFLSFYMHPDGRSQLFKVELFMRSILQEAFVACLERRLGPADRSGRWRRSTVDLRVGDHALSVTHRQIGEAFGSQRPAGCSSRTRRAPRG